MLYDVCWICGSIPMGFIPCAFFSSAFCLFCWSNAYSSVSGGGIRDHGFCPKCSQMASSKGLATRKNSVGDVTSEKRSKKNNNCMTQTKIIKNTWDTMLQMQYPQTTGLKQKPTINETAERNGVRKLLPWQSQNGTCFKSRMMLEHLMISLHALIATIPLVGSGGVLLTLGFWEQTPKPGEP